MNKLTIATLGLLLAACSNQAAQAPETDTTVDGVNATAPASADDDTLEPEAPKVEEGEEHNEEAPHSH